MSNVLGVQIEQSQICRIEPLRFHVFRLIGRGNFESTLFAERRCARAASGRENFRGLSGRWRFHFGMKSVAPRSTLAMSSNRFGPARLCIAIAVAVAVFLGGTYLTSTLAMADGDSSVAQWPTVPLVLVAVLVASALMSLLFVGRLLRQRSFRT